MGFMGCLVIGKRSSNRYLRAAAATIAVLLLLGLTAQSRAQVYYCQGRWTSKACTEKDIPVEGLPSISRPGNHQTHDPIEIVKALSSARSSQGTRSGYPVLAPTTVRTMGKPTVVWGEASCKRPNLVRVRKVEVTVKNVGNEVAHDVNVKIVMVDSKSYLLSGPSLLQPNQSAIYSGEAFARYPAVVSTSIRVSCRNCRKREI